MSYKTTKEVSTKEMLSHAFDLMMLLKAKAISVEEAKAQANLLKQGNNLLRIELDTAIAHQKYENLEVYSVTSVDKSE